MRYGCGSNDQQEIEMSEVVYLNGQFMPLADAHVSVLDRGFVFGDGVYEVIPVYSGHPFRLPEHLRRLANSLDAIRLASPLSDAQWTGLVHEMVTRNAGNDQSVYLQITRGVAKRDHAFPQGVAPTVFMMSNPLVTPAADQVANGARCISAVDYRWLRCDVKSISLLANCLMRQLAVDASTTEVIMFRDGKLTEASASNVFAVRNGVLLAPPKGRLILPGITYDVVLELARANGIACDVRDIAEDEVRNADEIWLTSSTKEVLATVELDGKPVGSGRPGKLFRRMHQLYQDYKRTVMRHAA
jgi:D-alanine transaminase